MIVIGATDVLDEAIRRPVRAHAEPVKRTDRITLSLHGEGLAALQEFADRLELGERWMDAVVHKARRPMLARLAWLVSG